MSGCDLCVEARASSARGVVVECACGEVYERGRWVDPSPQASADASPSGPVWPERGTAELVYHADPDAPMERRPPSALVPVATLDPDAKLRALLSELRPDRDGPYGWAPDGVEPLPPDIIRGADGKLREAVGPLVRVAMRVDGTAEVPAILPGAFASTGGVINPSRPPTLAGPLPMWSAGELVRERIEAMAAAMTKLADATAVVVDLLDKIIEVYKKRLGDMAGVVSEEMGAPLSFALTAQVGAGIGGFLGTIAALQEDRKSVV